MVSVVWRQCSEAYGGVSCCYVVEIISVSDGCAWVGDERERWIEIFLFLFFFLGL